MNIPTHIDAWWLLNARVLGHRPYTGKYHFNVILEIEAPRTSKGFMTMAYYA